MMTTILPAFRAMPGMAGFIVSATSTGAPGPGRGIALTRVKVFVDYQNTYMRARETFGEPRDDPFTFGQVRPLQLGQLLCRRGTA